MFMRRFFVVFLSFDRPLIAPTPASLVTTVFSFSELAALHHSQPSGLIP